MEKSSCRYTCDSCLSDSFQHETMRADKKAAAKAQFLLENDAVQYIKIKDWESINIYTCIYRRYRDDLEI